MSSFDFESKSLFWQKQIDIHAESVALKSIITQLLCGFSIPQSDVAKESLDKGWFHSDYGSSFDDFVELLKWDASKSQECFLTVDVISNSSLAELTEYVDSSDEIICYVNRMLLEQDGDYRYPGLNADGLVHIIGINYSKDNADFVFINDVSSDSGAGKRILLESFLNVWSASDYTAITIAWR